MRNTVHPITAETLPIGVPISEPEVLVWLGERIIVQRAIAMAREALSYKWQGGDPA